MPPLETIQLGYDIDGHPMEKIPSEKPTSKGSKRGRRRKMKVRRKGEREKKLPSKDLLFILSLSIPHKDTTSTSIHTYKDDIEARTI